jgi:hypothetical protein
MNLHNLFESSNSQPNFVIGDPVIITGDVEFRGKTGDVQEFDRDGAFVVVNLYNYGPYSFHVSDVEYNDYADSEDAEDVAEATPETTVSALRGYKTWQVWIKNNYYNGKYPDYSARPYRVIASSADEARQVVLDNADRVLKDLLSKKFPSGKRVLPPRSALPIEAKHIGAVDDGTEKGQITTSRPITMLSPQGPMTVMLDAGNIVDVEQGVAEGSSGEELANEVYAEFERMYPNLARRADERIVHAAIIDVLNYGGDSDPGALAQDVARAVKRNMQGVAEVTGDEKFDKMLKGVTSKKAVAKQQKTDTKQQARDAFGGMFGGGNPADKLSIRPKGVAEQEKAERAEKNDQPWVDPKLKRRMDYAFGHYAGYKDKPEAFFKWVMNSIDHSEQTDQQHDERFDRIEREIEQLSQRLNQVNEQHGAAVANRFSQRLVEHFELDRPTTDPTRSVFVESRAAKQAAIREIFARQG